MRIILSLLLILSVASTSFAGETVKFVFDVRPAGILVSSKVDGFSAASSSSSYYYSSFRSETVDGSLSLMPNARLGIGIDAGVLNLDLTGGGGFLYNAAFTAPFTMVDAAARFKLGSAVTMGPHVGVLAFSEPKWSGDAPIKFSSNTGVMGGLDFTAGRSFAFKASVDFVKASFDAKMERGSNWYLSDNELDISGVALQLGFTGRF